MKPISFEDVCKNSIASVNDQFAEHSRFEVESKTRATMMPMAVVLNERSAMLIPGPVDGYGPGDKDHHAAMIRAAAAATRAYAVGFATEVSMVSLDAGEDPNAMPENISEDPRSVDMLLLHVEYAGKPLRMYTAKVVVVDGTRELEPWTSNDYTEVDGRFTGFLPDDVYGPAGEA